MNEVLSLNKTVELLDGLNPHAKFEHIVVLSESSTKESIDNAQLLQSDFPDRVKVIFQTLPGLGGALRSAIECSSGDYILMMASDLETDPTYVPNMLSTSCKYPEAIISTTRWAKKSEGFVEYGKAKLFLNWLFQKLLIILFDAKISDLTYGFRLYPREVIQAMEWQRTDFAFLLESILRPLKSEVHVIEVPVVWKKRNEGISNNSFTQMFRYLTVALEIRFSK